MTKALTRSEMNLILLVDGSRESGLAREVLTHRQIKFSEVDINTLTGPAELRPQYGSYPTFLVFGTAYVGLEEVKRCANSNLYLI